MPFLWVAASLVAAAAGGLAAATKPWLAGVGLFAALAGVGLRKLGLWRSVYAVTLTLLLCATSSLPVLQTVSFYPRYLATATLAAVTYLGHRNSTVTLKQLPWTARWLVNGMFLAAAVGTVSSLWSADRLLTLQQSAALIILATTVHALVTRRWTNRSLIGGDLAVAYWALTICSTLSVIASFAGVLNTESYSGRLHGVASNPNTLALLCMLAIPLGWFVYRQQGKKIALIGIIPSGIAVMMTETRGALLGLALGLTLVIARRGISNIFRAATLAIGLVGVLALAGFLLPIVESPTVAAIANRFLNDEGGDHLSGRSLAWSETVALIAERPATGYGYSAGPSLFPQLRSAGQLAFELDSAHNSYLQWMLETGLLGLPAILILLAASIVVVVRGGKTPATAGIAWCIVGGLCLQATESAMLGTGQVYPSVFWLVVAGGSVLAVQREVGARVP